MFNRSVVVLLLVAASAAGCASSGTVPAPVSAMTAPSSASVTAHVALSAPTAGVTIAKPALYPETLEVNPLTGRFIVGSLREGAVYEVDSSGNVQPLVQDDRLVSVLGIAVDARNHRLIATNSDLGAGIKHSPRGAKKEAGVGIYDLRTGAALQYVDLAALRPEADHLINGVTIDARGDAYLTDSFSPAIYKVDAAGVASVFLENDEFKGPGVNLNGIAYHPAGFLLVIKKSSGVLYRVPLADPQHFTRVSLPATCVGGDGLSLIGEERLVLVANKTPDANSNAAFLLESKDGWATASVVESQTLGEVYPTTSVIQGDGIYALSTHLDEWLGATAATRDAIAHTGRQAEIRRIGSIGGNLPQPPAAAAISPPAANGIRRTLVRREPAHENGWETRLYLIEYPPGVAAPPHFHPAVGVGWVIDGEFEHAFGDEPLSRVKAGEGFTDQAEVTHRVFRNASADRPLRFLIAYTMRAQDEPVRFQP